MSRRSYSEQLEYYNCSSNMELCRKAAYGEVEPEDMEVLYAQALYTEDIGAKILLTDAIKELTSKLK